MKTRVLVAVFLATLMAAPGVASEQRAVGGPRPPEAAEVAAPACQGEAPSSLAGILAAPEGVPAGGGGAEYADGPVCAWMSERPCPSEGDCGYDFDGVCCTPRCPRPFLCIGFCYI
jgi:hypothetical protein